MFPVEMYVQVRRACMVEGVSVREASRVFGLHQDTVRKYAYAGKPPTKKLNAQERAKLQAPRKSATVAN